LEVAKKKGGMAKIDVCGVNVKNAGENKIYHIKENFCSSQFELFFHHILLCCKWLTAHLLDAHS
jgi:hypothetical protein